MVDSDSKDKVACFENEPSGPKYKTSSHRNDTTFLRLVELVGWCNMSLISIQMWLARPNHAFNFDHRTCVPKQLQKLKERNKTTLKKLITFIS